MKAMIYPSIFLFLFGILGCSQDEHIEDQDPECIELTVDNSLYNYLATDTVPLNPCAEIENPMTVLVDECLRVKISWGGGGRPSLVYQLVWSGEITNDTADVHFYIYDPNYVQGQQMLAILGRKTIAFEIGEIVHASNSENLFLQTHYYDAYYADRYRKVIQLR